MPDTDPGLLVLDIDNTVYDWIGIWARAFDAMTRVLARDTGMEVTHWHAVLRHVHQRRQALEYPGVLEELAVDERWVHARASGATLARAATVYRRAWDTQLAPYDGVRESLVRLVQQGWQVVGYTESDVVITASRLTRMGLAGVLPRVFGRAPLTTPTRRECALVEIPLRVPIAVDHVPRADMKPNPVGLRDIVHRCRGDLARTVYVGDNLWKDVAMARRLGVRALWAEYGTHRRPEQIALLESVAHWTRADVVDERAAAAQTVTPDAILRDASELLDAVAAPAAVPVAIG